MKKFSYPLERILSWRGKALEAEEVRLGTYLMDLSRLKTAHQQLVEAWDVATADVLETGTTDGGQLAALGSYRKWLERECEVNQGKQRNQEEKISAQRARVLDAHRRVRLLEKLRARRFENWRLEWNRETEDLASEAFLARWRVRH